MASKREKMLLAGGGGAAVIVVMFLYLIIPSFDAITAKTTEIDQKKAEVDTYQSQITTLSAEVAQLEKLKALPPGLDVRKYAEGTLQQNVKAMLDTMVTVATDQGNDLVGLVPWPEAPSYSPDPAEAAPAQPQVDEQGNPVPPPPAPTGPNLDTFGYTLELRGSYDSIVGFLSFVSHHHELMEIHKVTLENEAGEDREQSGESAQLIDPFKPIKVSVNFVLFLQPQ